MSVLPELLQVIQFLCTVYCLGLLRQPRNSAAIIREVFGWAKSTQFTGQLTAVGLILITLEQNQGITILTIS